MIHLRARVSRALRDHPAIANDTIARVKQAAELHGYQPKESVHRYFKALRGQVNGIAFLVDKKIQELLTAHDPFYTQILWSVERALQKTGTHMILTNIHNNLTPRGSLHAIDEGIANGVIIKSHDPSVVANLAKNTSVVVLDSATRSQNVDAVIPDVDRAVRNQMDYLMELGHRRIANFRQRPTPGTAYHHWQDRCFWREYEDYAADLGLLIPESWKAPILITPDNEIEVMEAFLDRILEGDRPTAILTYDLYAGELIHRLAKRGLSVPGDISIVGFDDATHGRFCPIPLTTYRQDFDAMANEAVTLVRERIKNPARSPRIVKIDGKMIIRDSVAPARP